MSQQTNARIKRARRKAYVKRKKVAAKTARATRKPSKTSKKA